LTAISTEAEIRRYFPSPQRPLSQRERGERTMVMVPKHVLGPRVCRPKTCFGTPCVPRVCRPQTGLGTPCVPRGCRPQTCFPRSHAPAWECREQRASVAGKGRWRVPTAFHAGAWEREETLTDMITKSEEGREREEVVTLLHVLETDREVDPDSNGLKCVESPEKPIAPTEFHFE